VVTGSEQGQAGLHWRGKTVSTWSLRGAVGGDADVRRGLGRRERSENILWFQDIRSTPHVPDESSNAPWSTWTLVTLGQTLEILG
jgi:hypothetical protein